VICLKPREGAKEFLKFLRSIDKAVPARRHVHLVLDNYATHKTPEVKAWLDTSRLPVRKHTPTETNGWFGTGFSDATRGGLCIADRCLASEKRSSGKSWGWAWWNGRAYGDLMGARASYPI
jgi:hypothetical protein